MRGLQLKRYIEGRSMFEIQIKVVQSIISAVGSIILSFSCEHTVRLDGVVWLVKTIVFFFLVRMLLTNG